MHLLHAFFEEQAQKNPESVAIEACNKIITYRWLSAFSNQIAHRLQFLGSKPNTLVAVMMEKGWEQIAAVLGILKSGAAYLPIDPADSQERVFHLLSTAQVSIVLTQEHLKKNLEWPTKIQCLSIDALEEWNSFPNLPPSTMQSKEDLAYVIFTSGTTGVPKGVMIDHQAALNTILDINHRFNVNSSDKILAVSSLHFDLSVYDIFGTLAAGGTIVVPTGCDSVDPTTWLEIFLKKKITICNCVPALFQLLVEDLTQKTNEHILNHRLRLLLFSGDWIPVTLPTKIRLIFGSVEIISLGGATEASIWSILYPIKTVDELMQSIPYGKPLINQTFYILDETLNPVSPGEIGELYIGGIGLAKGYWQDKKRTQLSFIKHSKLGKLYKTGDLGRYYPDGNIEFLGRVDHQVKVHGYRIEISAIENCLLEIPMIKQVAVIAAGKEYNKKLVAYIVVNTKFLKENQLLSETQIEEWHTIHDGMAGIKNSIANPTFNTLGWTNSFTGQPVPTPEMEEWVNETVKRIMDLKPKRVLEFGCGLGLLLFRIAPQVAKYDAIDYAETAINYVKDLTKELNIKHVKLTPCEVINFSPPASTEYDLVIINSVIQYFSGVDYLLEVINKAINSVKKGGYIFIGDVRHLAHLKMFYSAAFLSRAKKRILYKEWKNLVIRHIDNEEELLVDHQFFYALKSIHHRISAVDIQIKRGNYQNEMIRFRYDVVLYLDDNPSIQMPHIDWINWQKDYLNIEKIEKILKDQKPNYLAIKNICNQRTVGLEHLLDQSFSEKSLWITTLQNNIALSKQNAIDPGRLYSLGDKQSYNLSVTWSKENPKSYIDAIFLKTTRMAE